MIISDVAADTVRETARQPEKVIKGQKARSGPNRPGFEGGQMPLYRRIPKRGFTNRNTKEIVGINLAVLERFDDGATVDVEALISAGIVKNPRDGVKILGNGEFTKKLTVQANAFSASAKRKDRGAWWNSRGDLMLKTLKNAFKVKEIRKKDFVYAGNAGCDPYRITASRAGCEQGICQRVVYHACR